MLNYLPLYLCILAFKWCWWYSVFLNWPINYIFQKFSRTTHLSMTMQTFYSGRGSQTVQLGLPGSNAPDPSAGGSMSFFRAVPHESIRRWNNCTYPDTDWCLRQNGLHPHFTSLHFLTGVQMTEALVFSCRKSECSLAIMVYIVHQFKQDYANNDPREVCFQRVKVKCC